MRFFPLYLAPAVLVLWSGLLMDALLNVLYTVLCWPLTTVHAVVALHARWVNRRTDQRIRAIEAKLLHGKTCRLPLPAPADAAPVMHHHQEMEVLMPDRGRPVPQPLFVLESPLGLLGAGSAIVLGTGGLWWQLEPDGEAAIILLVLLTFGLTALAIGSVWALSRRRGKASE